jgi:hypothetical protein
MSEGRRSTREIRRSLAATRGRLDEDLEELELRAEDSLSPRHLFMRHPALVTIAGAVFGVVVVRNPALVARSLSRLAGISAPWLLKALLHRASATADRGADSG